MATETKAKVKEVAAKVGSTALSATKGVAGIPQPVWTLLAVAAGVWLIGKTIKEATADQKALEFDKGKDEVKGKTAQDGSQQPTITANEAMGIAELQQEAMGNPGTNWQRLTDSLKGLNGKDLQLVFNAFGSRWYDPLTGSTSGKIWPTAESLNLFGWYAQELDNGEMNAMRAIWQKSGLKF